MLQDLGVGYIAARSPQAKGRIERLWETLQDRLVSELRVRQIASVDAAQAYVPEFIADFNRRFGKPPAAPRTLFGVGRPASSPSSSAVAIGASWPATTPSASAPAGSNCAAAARTPGWPRTSASSSTAPDRLAR